MLRIVALAACLLALPSPAFAIGLYCAIVDSIPPEAQRAPTVRYEVHTIPSGVLNTRYCINPDAGEVVGCTYSAASGWRWIIVIADTVSAEDYPCVLAYEKAHLPPNCWGNATMERPETMDYINNELKSSASCQTP